MLFARARVIVNMSEQWWLEEIDPKGGGGFILIHATRGHDVAARINWDREKPPELRKHLAEMITELRELIQQPEIWVKN